MPILGTIIPKAGMMSMVRGVLVTGLAAAAPFSFVHRLTIAHVFYGGVNTILSREGLSDYRPLAMGEP